MFKRLSPAGILAARPGLARRLPLAAALLVFIVVAVVLVRQVGPKASTPAQGAYPGSALVSSAGGPGLAPAAPAAAPTTAAVTGQIALSDFRIVIPAGWQRRPDLEEQGPGTKLFLEGPTVGAGQIYVGIDVYPLPQGMTVQDFIARYSSQWAQAAPLADQPATLAGQPARMLAMSDGQMDKLFLVAVRGDRGFAIGMFGPTGQSAQNVKAYQAVLNTFQFYQ